nr:unnamed protein product [Naegleria fowleri]
MRKSNLFVACLYNNSTFKNRNPFVVYPFIATTIRSFSTTIHDLNQPNTVPYFPYGESNFESIRRNKQFYVDKTHLIPLLDKSSKQLFFVRPPRWGKSLLLSMLQSYYDINKKEQFNELFDGLWIGDPKNQTSLKNEYYILNLDFSVEVDGSPENIKQALHESINADIARFLTIYNLEDDIPKIISPDALISFENLVTTMIKHKSKLMVLIDEYDRFANKLMFESPEKYKHIVEGKRGEATSSLIRSFFERLKKTSRAGLTDFRSLIVGITPIAIADASGYNVASNISQSEEFGDLVGFTENDLRTALNNIGIVENHQNNAISIMKKFYNGYHFPGSTQSLFNPTLSMHFLQKLMSKSRFKSAVIGGKDIGLEDMIDPNTDISENVFATLATTPASASIVHQLTATNTVQLNAAIVSSFKLRDIIDPPTNEENSKQIWDHTLSFMYYHGMLTFPKGLDSSTLIIPNAIAKLQYLEQLKRIISLNESIIEKFINHPTEDNLKSLLWTILKQQETIYDNSMSEGGLQGSIEAALRAQKLKLFDLTAEKEYKVFKNGKEYSYRSDLVIKTANDVFIIEFKRVRPNALEEYSRLNFFPSTYKTVFKKLLQVDEISLLSMKVKWNTEPTTVENILNKAAIQVKEYAQHESNISKGKTIHAFVVVQVAWPLIIRKVN